MNHHCRQLPEFEVDAGKAIEALQCLVHTMVYVRCIGDSFEPLYQECTTFPLTYASCDSNEVSLQIDKELSEFLGSLRRISPGERKGTLRVCFSTKTDGSKVKPSIFEEWQIPVVVSDATPPATMDAVFAEARKRQDEETMNAVRTRVIHIIREASASETKLPERSVHSASVGSTSAAGGGSGGGSSGGSSGSNGGGRNAFPYDLVLLYQGKIQTKKSSSGGFLSSAKSFASSWFG